MLVMKIENMRRRLWWMALLDVDAECQTKKMLDSGYRTRV